MGSYLGMRKVSLDRTTPTSPLRIFLNNNATLQIGLLDQVSGSPCKLPNIDTGALHRCIDAGDNCLLQTCQDTQVWKGMYWTRYMYGTGKHSALLCRHARAYAFFCHAVSATSQ